jgi:hypothetical protein
MHAGYLRHYLEPLRLLAERGAHIHLSFGQPDKEPVDTLLVKRLLAAGSHVSAGYGPERSPLDGWRRLAWVVRGLTDLSRYSHPRYAQAFALRNRMRAKVVDRIRSSRMEPVGKAVVIRAADRIAAADGAEAAARNARRLAHLEAAIPPSRRHVALLRDWRPDVVLASPVVEVASPQVEWIKAARSEGIPSGVAIASWDNLTNKGLIRVLPDRVLVWNEIQRGEAVELHGVEPGAVIVTGAQKFDEWFERQPSTTFVEFAAKAGVTADSPFVLYLGSSPFIAPDEVSFVRRWLEALRSSGRPSLEQVGVVVRPHPQNGRQWQSFDPPPGVVVWPPAGAQPDSGEARADFFDSISHASAVVGINTSALIESGIVGRSVFTVLDPAFAGTQEGTLHFHYLLEENGGFLHVARDLDAHVEQLERGLAGSAQDAERTRRFAESFVRPHGLDVPAAPRVAEAIETIAALGRREPEPPALGTRALRLALTPFAAGNAAVAAAVKVLLALRGRRAPALDSDD